MYFYAVLGKQPCQDLSNVFYAQGSPVFRIMLWVSTGSWEGCVIFLHQKFRNKMALLESYLHFYNPGQQMSNLINWPYLFFFFLFNFSFRKQSHFYSWSKCPHDLWQQRVKANKATKPGTFDNASEGRSFCACLLANSRWKKGNYSKFKHGIIEQHNVFTFTHTYLEFKSTDTLCHWFYNSHTYKSHQ